MKNEGIKREKGFLYFLGKDGYIWAAPMKHNTTGKKHMVSTQKVDIHEMREAFAESIWKHPSNKDHSNNDNKK